MVVGKRPTPAAQKRARTARSSISPHGYFYSSATGADEQPDFQGIGALTLQ